MASPRTGPTSSRGALVSRVMAPPMEGSRVEDRRASMRPQSHMPIALAAVALDPGSGSVLAPRAQGLNNTQHKSEHQFGMPGHYSKRQCLLWLRHSGV